MKRILMAAACLAALSSAAAQAGVLNVSYTFDDSTTISGQITGDVVGGFLENISDVHLFMNGTAFNGPLLVGAWDSAAGMFDTSVAPTLSLTDAALNNFIFADGSTPLGSDTTNWFYMSSAADLLAAGAPAVFGALVDGTAAFDDVPNGSWRAVPLPATGLLFCAAGGLAAALRRRRPA